MELQFCQSKYEELFWDVIRKGMSVAVVFHKPINMTTWRGYKVVDGDKDDLRFLDPQSSIVAPMQRVQLNMTAQDLCKIYRRINHVCNTSN